MLQMSEYRIPPFRWALLSVVAVLLLAVPAAAIGIDATSSGHTYGSSLTVAHTVSGVDRLLLVSVNLNESATVSSVTCNGLALTRRLSVVHTSTQPKVELWYRVAPPEGAVSVVVTLQGASSNMAANVVSLTGVNQSSPFYGSTSDKGTNGDPMVVVSSRAGDLVLDFLASTSTGTPTVGSNQTVIATEVMGSSSHYSAVSWEAGANAVEMRWRLDEGNKNWVIVAASLAPSYYTYYVAVGGDNGKDGTTPATAWASINNGETKSVMGPGDTVNVLAGTYSIAASLTLSTGGTASKPIVYRASGGTVIVNAGGGSFDTFVITGDYTTLDGFQMTNSTDNGITVSGAYATVKNCYVHNDSGDDGIYVDGDHALLYRNTISGVNVHGINIRLAASQTHVYHNVIYNNSQNGIEFQSSSNTARVFNNIVMQNAKGINAPTSGNVIAFNDVYNNSVGDYMGAAVDSAGGISVNPWFVAPASGNFALQAGSQCIDAGHDLGYSYRGAAPDMGAVEAQTNCPPTLAAIGAQSTTEHVTLTVGVSATDPESIPSLTTSTRPTGATFTDHGNGTGTFVWTPGYPTAGEYELTFYATDDSLAVDSERVTITVDPAALDYLTVTPDITSVTADNGKQFSVAGYDVSGNRADSGQITWSVTAPVGTIDAGGWFDATTAGTARVVATSSYGPADSTTQLQVTEGVLTTLTVSAPSYTVSADSTRQFSAAGVDADGNAVSALGTLTWSVLGDIGTINSSGLFTATHVGGGVIRAVSSLGPSDLSDSVFVTPGVLSHYSILPDADVVEQGTTRQFAAYGYDSDYNLIGTFTDSSTWTTDDPTGSVDVAGLYTAGSSISPPDYYVKGTYGAFADSSVVTVISNGQLSYIRVEYADGSEALDTSLTTDNDTTLYSCRAYDSGNNPLGTVDVTWSLIGDVVGSLSDTAEGLVQLQLTAPGIARLMATYEGGFADTSGVITVHSGAPHHLTVSPETATIAADSSLAFTCASLDADDNVSTPEVDVVFSVLDGIGEIDSLTGWFVPQVTGAGYIVATGGGLADTTGIIRVTPGPLFTVEIQPDSAAVNIGDHVQFTLTGRDALGNERPPGSITWKLLGRNGYLDADGLFEATRGGSARVAASVGGSLADTSDLILVEQVVLSTIPVGNNTVAPGAETPSLFTFQLDNFFDEIKSLSGLTVHLNIGGPGLPAQRLTDVDSLMLYVDANDDSLLNGPDTRLDAVAAADSVEFNFSPLDIPARGSRVLFVSATASEAPRDGDELDMYLYPATGMTFSDATPVYGVDSANCYGQTRFDGLIANQLTVTASGSALVSPGDDPVVAMTIDVPRNGYASDILTAFSITNSGNAVASDLATLTLLRDDGNGTFDSYDSETYVGRLVYTGDRWTLSGLSVPLNDPTTRFYVTVTLSSYPVGGHKFIATIPLNGVTVQSANDGPYDQTVQATDTITVKTNEQITATAYSLDAQTLIPGELSEPLLALSLHNDYMVSVALDSLEVDLTWSNTSVGVSASALDSQLDSLLLYLDGGAYDLREAADQLLATAVVADGHAVFRLSGVEITQQGGQIDLAVVAAVDQANARDGNHLDLSIEDGYLHFGQVVTLDATLPLTNPVSHVVDIFPAASVVTHELPAADMSAGGLNKLLFDFELPGNGYAADSLSALTVENLGTVLDAIAFTTVRLWADVNDDGFDGDESLVGLMTAVPEGWSIRSLKYPIPVGGRRFMITADVASAQFESGTVLMAIPVDGCQYRSGANGPDDLAVTCPDEARIYPANRITAISIPRASAALVPGSSGNNLLTFALYNGYGTASQTLEGLTLTNGTRTRSTSEFADYEIGQVSLMFDADKNRTLENDSLIASGYFSKGALHFSGINIALAAESLSYFYVVSDVPLNLIDGDSLTTTISAPSSFTFSEAVVVNGDLPLSAGGYLIADGSVAAQYTILDLESGTLSPGDANVPLFAFLPASNGDQTDLLQSLTLENVADADSSDLFNLRLWLDRDDDQTWQATDSLLGTFNYTDGRWVLSGLTVGVPPTPAALFVTGDVALGATPGVLFQARLPLNGCMYASTNDGPIDAPLVAPNEFAVSSSGLGISYTPLASAYTIGQTVPVSFTVTNRLSSTIDDVTGAVVGCTDSTIVSSDSAHTGPVTLAAGESVQFAGYYTAIAAGSVAFQVQAVASTGADSSAVLQTNTTHLQGLPADVPVRLVSSIPTAVTRGQTNVFPLSISYTNDSDSTTAAIRLDSLRLDILDGSGQPLQAAGLFGRMVLSSGYTELTVFETPPAQSAVWMIFDEPVIVSPGGSRKLSLLVDIDSLTTTQGFSISLPGASAIGFVDANSLQPVTISSTVVFPLTTPLCRVEDRSQQMAVSYVSLVGPTVNRGQDDVDVLQLTLRHPGETGSSQIQLTNLSFRLLDGDDNPLPVSELLMLARLMKRQTVIAEVDCSDLDTADVGMQLNSPVSLNPGEIDSIRVALTLKNVTDITGFSVYIADSLAFTVRELSSGTSLQAATDTSLWATGSVFPVQSSETTLKEPAGDLTLCLSAPLPASTVGGRDSLCLFELDCQYPASDEYSSLNLKRLLVSVIDSTGAPINPVELFDHIGFVSPIGALSYQTFIPLDGGAAVFELGDDGWEITPGDSIGLRLVADISTGTDIDNFALVLETPAAVELVDATDTTRHPMIHPTLDCDFTYPFVSTVTSVYQPAGRPALDAVSQAAVIAPRGALGITIFNRLLEYDSPLPQGAVELSALHGRVYKRTSAGLVPTRESEVFSRLSLMIDSDTAALDDNLGDDTVALVLTTPTVVEHGETPGLGLVVDINPAAPLGNYVIRFEDSTFLAMNDRNLATAVYPVLSGGYPLLTDEISVVDDGFEASFTNYPNPFVPDEGSTTIGFVLPEVARVDIELFTITGDLIKTVTANDYRAAGAHQSDTWNGRNDGGREVVPGTYYCRITARYDSGRTESYRRKVAVLR